MKICYNILQSIVNLTLSYRIVAIFEFAFQSENIFISPVYPFARLHVQYKRITRILEVAGLLNLPVLKPKKYRVQPIDRNRNENK